MKAAAPEALLSATEAGALCGGINEQNWPAYAARWPALRDGMRIVRVSDPGSRGRMRWLRSAVTKHIVQELLQPDLDAGHARHSSNPKGDGRCVSGQRSHGAPETGA